MEGATHFIEQWNWKGFTITEYVRPLSELYSSLAATKINNGYTVAIWYIKPKQK